MMLDGLRRATRRSGGRGGEDASAGPARVLAASPVVWRGAVAALGVTALLVARTGVTGLFDEIVGMTMIAIAIVEQIPRLLGGPPVPWWRSAVAASIGAAIVLWPSETGRSVGLLAALAIAIYGIGKVIQAFRSAAHERKRDRLARGSLTVALAVVVAVFPDATVRVVVVGIGVLFILQAAHVAAAIGRAHAGGDPATEVAPASTALPRQLARHDMPQADRDRIDAALFIDGGGDARRRLFRFSTLMGLSTAIATFGIANDSTAVVIGAMLIAPLMTPILATASAVLQGWTVRALRSGATVVLAALGAVVVAYVLSAFVPDIVAVVANDEVTSRTAPNLLDLAIAVAAGAAGAFAVNRADVSDTLPGVAVAIALVPPLAVTGVTLYAGHVEQALGAALLFGTNLVAILATASIVFVLTGYVAWSRLQRERSRVRASYATVATGVVLLLLPLGLTSRNLINEAARSRTSQRVVGEWIAEQRGVRLTGLDVDDDQVMVTLHGPGTPSQARDLHTALVDALGAPVTLELHVVPEVQQVVGGGS